MPFIVTYNEFSAQHPTSPRKTSRQLVDGVLKTLSKDRMKTTGVELDTEDFTRIRFGTDRRLEEAARMLCSSTIPHIRAVERPELKCILYTSP